MALFFWMLLSCLKAIEPLRGDSWKIFDMKMVEWLGNKVTSKKVFYEPYLEIYRKACIAGHVN